MAWHRTLVHGMASDPGTWHGYGPWYMATDPGTWLRTLDIGPWTLNTAIQRALDPKYGHLEGPGSHIWPYEGPGGHIWPYEGPGL